MIDSHKPHVDTEVRELKTRLQSLFGRILVVVVPMIPGAMLQAAPAEEAEPGVAAPVAKTDTGSARLLVPFYSVDTTSPVGTTTLYAVRNELDVPADIAVHYFRTDAPQAAQRTDEVTLAAKQVMPINIRFVDGLQADGDGVARGYVVVEASTEGAVIQGDYFRVTPGEDFASGFRMRNIDSLSPHSDLCGLFSLRFLNGGGFDSGTRFIIWLESDQAPDGEEPVLIYSAYDESGDLVLSSSLFADDVAFEITAASLFPSPLSVDFGAIEFQFVGTVGHISAVLSAENRYSVGLEAACGDL